VGGPEHISRTLAGGRYRLDALLGEGGMAAVHHGHDTRLDRPVAIKTMHPELGRDASARSRFQREALTVARLNHPNVVAVHDSGEEPSPDGSAPSAYIVMELVDGTPLSRVLTRDRTDRGGLPLTEALRIASDVLAALAAAHEIGLVHRDIKPDNVMLGPRGLVKVMDFGIARAGQQSPATALTGTGNFIGTPHYLPPEQARGEREVDGRSDLYSLGVLLFELIGGRVPFDADSALSVVVKHLQDPPPSLASVGVPVPAGVEALLARALRKDPGERHASAAEMRAEVDRLRAALLQPTPTAGPAATVAEPQPVAPRPAAPPSVPPRQRPAQGPPQGPTASAPRPAAQPRFQPQPQHQPQQPQQPQPGWELLSSQLHPQSTRQPIPQPRTPPQSGARPHIGSPTASPARRGLAALPPENLSILSTIAPVAAVVLGIALSSLTEDIQLGLALAGVISSVGAVAGFIALREKKRQRKRLRQRADDIGCMSWVGLVANVPIGILGLVFLAIVVSGNGAGPG
jgi:serine/threonine-protein kinase